LAHLKECLNSIQTNLRILLKFIDNLQQAYLPRIDFQLDVLLVFRTEKNINGLFNDLVDMSIFIHSFYEIEVKGVSIHLSSAVPDESSL
jgi:hypothetical protein